jgi:hypothetical protein
MQIHTEHDVVRLASQGLVINEWGRKSNSDLNFKAWVTCLLKEKNSLIISIILRCHEFCTEHMW